jgi:hypothetical protein
VCLHFRHKFLGPPHGLDCFTLAHAGNTVVSLVPDAQEICKGPAQSRWVLLGLMDQSADKSLMNNCMPPKVFRVRGKISLLSKAAIAT